MSIVAAVFLAAQANAGEQADFGARAVKILRNVAYLWSVDDVEKPPAFLEVRPGEAGVGSERKFHLFPENVAVQRTRHVAWDLAQGMLFVVEATQPTWSAMGSDWAICRFPVDLLVSGPRWAWPLPPPKKRINAEGRKVFVLDERGYMPPSYGRVHPLRLLGCKFWNPAPTVFSDVRAIDDERLELYLSDNGRLSAWHYEGTKWTQARDIRCRVEGPFRIAANRKSALVRSRHEWTAIGDIEDPESPRKQIKIDRHAGTALLVDDLDRSETFLVQGDTFMAIGRRLGEAQPLERARGTVKDAVRRALRIIGREKPLRTAATRPSEEPSPAAGERAEQKESLRKRTLENEKLLKELAKARHVGKELHQRALALIESGQLGALSDDAAAMLLSGIDKLDGADVLMTCYEVCAPEVGSLRLEEPTKREWKRHDELKDVLYEFFGGDEMLGLFVRLGTIEELREQAAICRQKKENEPRAARIEQFVREEAKKLLAEWKRLVEDSDLRGMIQELVGTGARGGEEGEE